jgi:hypothetical protein
MYRIVLTTIGVGIPVAAFFALRAIGVHPGATYFVGILILEEWRASGRAADELYPWDVTTWR